MSIQELASSHAQRIMGRTQQRTDRQSALRAAHLAETLAGAPPFDDGALLGVNPGGPSFAPQPDILLDGTLSTPVLVAEGDSWFDYPRSDVLDNLEEIYGYEISSAANAGDTLESMAYSEDQLDGFDKRLKKLQERGKRPKAILLSAGGNDLAGREFEIVLNHIASGLETLNDNIVTGLIEVRLRAAYTKLILTIGEICAERFGNDKIPVLVHGYGHPVPDGRGVLGGWGPLPGPWLEPGFQHKGYRETRQRNIQNMEILIDRFNAMLLDLLTDPDLAHVRHVELRGALSNNPASYKADWANELHPTQDRFSDISKLFQDVLATLPP